MRRCSAGAQRFRHRARSAGKTGASHGRKRGAAAWKTVYAAPEKHWMLYELAEKLVDFEDYFRRWRFNHVTTVERSSG